MNNTLLLQNIDAFQAAISQTSEIGIVIGSHQTLDKMAAALALYLSLRQAGKNVQIVSSTDPIVEHSNLVGVDKVKKSFSGSTKTVVLSVPFREGEVEKVSYSTEGDRMNFSIIGGDTGITPFDIQDIQIMNRGSAPDFIISVGVPHESELKAFAENVGKIMNIDNTDGNERYGEIQFVDREFSSLSEIVTIIIQELALPLDIDIAQNLMDGVTDATKNFTASYTGSFAFESAAILLRVGAKRNSINANFRPQQNQKLVQNKQSMPRNGFQSGQSETPSPIQNIRQQLQSQPQPQYNSTSIENKETKPLSDEDFGEPQDVPSDWFVPKVFKGSKKPGGGQG